MKEIEFVKPEDIEKRSFEIIAKELAEKGISLPAEQDMITRRVIHTSADRMWQKKQKSAALPVQLSAWNVQQRLKNQSSLPLAMRLRH